MSLRLAKLEEIPEIYKEFYKFEKGLKQKGLPPVFCFVRRDYLERCVKSKTLYYDNGVIAVVKQYKVANKKYGVQKGDWSIPEIFNIQPRNGAGTNFLKKLIKEKIKNNRIFTTIRDDNVGSIKFHIAFGYKRIANVTWSNGTLPGGMYIYDPN